MEKLMPTASRSTTNKNLSAVSRSASAPASKFHRSMSSDLRHLEKIYRGPCGSHDPNLDVGVSQNEIASLNRSPQRAWHRDLSSDMPFDSRLLHFFGSYALAGAGI
jgi:hypothetical protein